MMDLLLSVVALLLAFVGIIGCIVPLIPGNVLSYLALVCIACCSFSEPGTLYMVILLLLSAAVMAADFFLPALMTRRFGGTRAGAIGATVGVFVGFLFGPLGIIFGPFFGAILGELTHDKKDSKKAIRSGVGSFLAFIVGTGLKLAVAIYLLCVVVAECWSPMVEGIKSLC